MRGVPAALWDQRAEFTRESGARTHCTPKRFAQNLAYLQMPNLALGRDLMFDVSGAGRADTYGYDRDL